MPEDLSKDAVREANPVGDSPLTLLLNWWHVGAVHIITQENRAIDYGENRATEAYIALRSTIQMDGDWILEVDGKAQDLSTALEKHTNQINEFLNDVKGAEKAFRGLPWATGIGSTLLGMVMSHSEPWAWILVGGGGGAVIGVVMMWLIPRMLPPILRPFLPKLRKMLKVQTLFGNAASNEEELRSIASSIFLTHSSENSAN